jgi:hypothetical protein
VATVVDVKDLPRTLIDALGALGYKKTNICVRAAKTYRLQQAGFAGQRAFVCAVNLEDGRKETVYGSWGGANMFNRANLVDLDKEERPVPMNGAIIEGSEGNGVRASITVRPETLTPLLPERPDLSKEEWSALNIVGGIKGGYRREEFFRAGLGDYGPENPVVASLVQKGLVKVNKRGAVSVTTDGAAMRVERMGW